MARTRMRDIPEGQDYVVLPEPKDSYFPAAKARKQMMATDESRNIMAEVIENARIAAKNPRVTSNHELAERIDQYFAMASQRKMPPTIEELCLYCGVASSTFNDWKLGKKHPFRDGEESGVTTADIIKRAYDVMHAVDAAMAETGKIQPIIYIFRSKNLYGYRDSQDIVISSGDEHTNMTREQIEEIAKNLPDSCPVVDETGNVE